MASEAGLVMIQLFAIFVAAKLFGWLASLVKLPSVVGEIVAGIVLGSTFLAGWLSLEGEMAALEVLAQLGIVFLIFSVGLETPFEEMKKVGKTSIVVAILGVIVPFAVGFGLMALLGHTTLEALFVGAALVATSVGITARVLAEMGVLGRPEARIIMGAAVIDDVLGLLVLTVVESVGSSGGMDVFALLLLIVEALAFVILVMWWGGRVARRVFSPWNAVSRRFGWTAPAGVFGVALILCLGLSALAVTLGLAAIIGAFLCGMAFAATDESRKLEERFHVLGTFATPFFFAFVGLQVDLGAAWGVAGLALLVIALALATKLIGCGLGALSLGRNGAIAVGVGMMPRGEVGVIVALAGLGVGALSDSIYAVIVAMSLATTIVTPPILVWAFGRLPGRMGRPSFHGVAREG